MKVESVEAFPLKIRVGERLQGGTFGYSHFLTVLVKATADGVEGWGEAMTRSDPRATALLVKHVASGIVGQEFEDVKGAWGKAWKELRVRGHTRGTDVEALSGIEIALYDSVGKLLKTPVCRMLSGTCAQEVPVFAGSLFSSRGPLERQIELSKGKGLAGAKVKIGFGVEEDTRVLREIRTLWPDGMLVADANGAYDSKTAKKACSAFGPLGLAWFEEPVLSDDLEGYAALTGSGVRIGAGESWFAGDFRQPIDGRLVGVIEPSVSRCGGIGVEAEVAEDAKAKGIDFSPMTGMNSAISLAASIQVASAMGTVGVEYNPFQNPLQTDLATAIEAPRRGMVRVPSAPGLGIEVDRRFVESNAM